MDITRFLVENIIFVYWCCSPCLAAFFHTCQHVVPFLGGDYYPFLSILLLCISNHKYIHSCWEKGVHVVKCSVCKVNNKLHACISSCMYIHASRYLVNVSVATFRTMFNKYWEIEHVFWYWSPCIHIEKHQTLYLYNSLSQSFIRVRIAECSNYYCCQKGKTWQVYDTEKVVISIFCTSILIYSLGLPVFSRLHWIVIL